MDGDDDKPPKVVVRSTPKTDGDDDKAPKVIVQTIPKTDTTSSKTLIVVNDDTKKSEEPEHTKKKKKPGFFKEIMGEEFGHHTVLYNGGTNICSGPCLEQRFSKSV